MYEGDGGGKVFPSRVGWKLVGETIPGLVGIILKGMSGEDVIETGVIKLPSYGPGRLKEDTCELGK